MLHAEMTWSPYVKPICLPTAEIQDEEKTAFTAGYGLRYVKEKKKDEMVADQVKSSCLTNEIGPSAFEHCKGGVTRTIGNSLFASSYIF